VRAAARAATEYGEKAKTQGPSYETEAAPQQRGALYPCDRTIDITSGTAADSTQMRGLCQIIAKMRTVDEKNVIPSMPNTRLSLPKMYEMNVRTQLHFGDMR
jgi:hypothetical protein